MPNWCYNHLSASGPPEKLAIFANRVRSPEPLFQSTFPMPKKLYEVTAGSDEQYYMLFHLKKMPPWMMGDENIIKAGLNTPQLTDDQLEDVIALLDLEDKREIAQKYADNVANYGHLHWYDWALENWGTKWDVGNDQIYETTPGYEPGVFNKFSFAFDTAWSPPEQWLYSVAKECPDLRFRLEYYELGGWFAGVLEVEHMVEIENHSGEPDAVDSNGEPIYPDAHEQVMMGREEEDESE